MAKNLVRITESQLHNIIKESVRGVLNTLNEGFKSNELRQWFSQHGGVKRIYTEPEYDGLVDKRVSQPGLGDVKDKDILYTEEFQDIKRPLTDEELRREEINKKWCEKQGLTYEMPEFKVTKAENQAFEKMQQLKASDRYTRQRSDWDMKAFFVTYKANDGSCLLVGIDRGDPHNPNYGFTWGGEVDKKTAQRRMANGWNHKTRSDRFYDMAKDTYFHQGPMNDFGLWTSDNYKGKMEDNKKKKERMTPEEWKQYVKDQLEHNENYLKNRYGKSFRKNKKSN